MVRLGVDLNDSKHNSEYIHLAFGMDYIQNLLYCGGVEKGSTGWTFVGVSSGSGVIAQSPQYVKSLVV